MQTRDDVVVACNPDAEEHVVIGLLASDDSDLVAVAGVDY